MVRVDTVAVVAAVVVSARFISPRSALAHLCDAVEDAADDPDGRNDDHDGDAGSDAAGVSAVDWSALWNKIVC